MIANPRLFLSFASLVAVAPFGWADTIHKTDGTMVEDASVATESLVEVAFTKSRSDQTIPSDQVLRVEFAQYPQEVDEALAYLGEGDFLSAMQTLDTYVDSQIARSTERRFKWAPAFAAWRVLEIRTQVADYPGAVKAAKRLTDNFPDSRYAPDAYLMKANVERWMGKTADAVATLDKLTGVIGSKSLSKRWDLACRLAKVLADPSKVGPAQRADLASIASEAGTTYPNVRNHARLAEGESYLVEAERKSASEANNLRDQARKVFDDLVADGASDDTVLAGAYTGLGDCLFFAGAAADDKTILKNAATQYLRVVLNHETESQYVPKALYYAFRCFQIMGDTSKKNDMKRELRSLYPDSPWAQRNDLNN